MEPRSMEYFAALAAGSQACLLLVASADASPATAVALAVAAARAGGRVACVRDDARNLDASGTTSTTMTAWSATAACSAPIQRRAAACGADPATGGVVPTDPVTSDGVRRGSSDGRRGGSGSSEDDIGDNGATTAATTEEPRPR
ncbi:uncharacterized protein LOC121055029 [Oryza brachyantha]|uniref:uncharacterized protein LOC121055029 n=1 Tax=Oryza brachyantha TaxID=4533 RepID=UPI001ADBA014|nr:uncharacterized protein LOC121055029 [Oryza brachyantha]XP_040382325.1 uncharacterized protein LOC121055029 [Oryza brachyantha]